MTEWCLVSEYLALIVTVIIGVFYFDLEQPSSKRRTHFWICLCLTATMIILDIAAVAVVGEGDHLPVALNYALNTVYCFVSIVTSCTIALFLFVGFTSLFLINGVDCMRLSVLWQCW